MKRYRESITELEKAAMLITESPDSTELQTAYIFNLLNEVSRRFITSEDYGTERLSDEPTTGLHFEDIKVLLGVLQQLVDQGNTVIIIEHNLDILKSVDYIFDLGPDGGQGGGRIVAEGTPEELAANPDSVTGPYLKEVL